MANNTGKGEADTTGVLKAVSVGSGEAASSGHEDISSTDKENSSEFRDSLYPVSSGCFHRSQ